MSDIEPHPEGVPFYGGASPRPPAPRRGSGFGQHRRSKPPWNDPAEGIRDSADDDVVRDVARTSIEASFAKSDIKEKLLSDLLVWPS